MQELWIKFASQQRRCLFVKEHKTTHGNLKTTGIFVAGLPVPLADEPYLHSLFQTYGEIRTIVMHPSKKSCIVLFTDPSSQQSLLAYIKSGKVLHCDAPLPVLGLKKWLDEYKKSFPGDEVLLKEVDDWMMQFEREEKEKKQASQNNTIDDGWTVVSRKKRKGIDLEGNPATSDQSTPSKKMKDYSDLYRISQKQSKMEAELSLRQKFDECKKRVAAYRMKREFQG